MSIKQSKLNLLAKLEGFDDPVDMLEHFITDDISPGICMNPNCDYTTNVEPDCRTGWCENCETNTVSAATELMFHIL